MISACIVIYNEIDLIKDLVSNIARLVDEIIIVHDGKSKNEVLNLAGVECQKNKIPYKFYENNYEGVAEPHRPFSFSKASYEWILWIDADERLVGNIDNIGSIINDESISVIKFKWGDAQELKADGFNKTKSILFRKDSCYYVGIPHQKPKPITGKVKLINEVNLLHLDQRRGFLNMIRRNIKWSKIMAEFYYSDISKIEIWNSNWEILENLKIKFKNKRKLVLFKIIGMPIIALYRSSLERNSMKLTTIRAINAFLLYFFILKMKIFKK